MCLPSQVNQLSAESLVSIESYMKTGVWLTETCQDYPEDGGFGLGDTVRIYRPGSRENNHVGLVGCQDPEKNPGKICLEGFKGCFLPEELRPINTLVFTFYTLGGAVGQIFGAIKDDVGDAWQDLKVGLSAFASSVSNKITDARAKVAEKVNFCAAGKGAESDKAFSKAAVQTKSRLAVLVDSAVERWGNLKEGIKSVAEATRAKLVKIANYLSETLSEFYDAHLKDIVEALKRYLGGIAAAVTNVPDELNPLAGGKPEVATMEVQAEPSGLSQAIEAFTDKVGELSAKVMELSQAAYDKVAAGLGALMSGTGRLIAAASQRWASIKAAVQRMATAAVEKVKEWGRQAVDFACNFDVKKTAAAAWASIQDGFQRAMDAVRRGYTYVKEGVQAVAESLAAMVVSAEVTIRTSAVGLWESDAVQGTLARLREEVRVLKELILEQASLVGKFVGGLVNYFGRFIPQYVKDKFSAAGQKAKELAKKIQDQIAELFSKMSHGETKTIEVDADTIPAEV